MNSEQFRQVLDSYGGEPSRWPEELRSSMHEFADGHDEAGTWLREARATDALLDSYKPDTTDLRSRILDAVPTAGSVDPAKETPPPIRHSVFERIVEWLIPHGTAGWWRPALAGCAPLVLGIAIGFVDKQAGELSPDWQAQEQALLMLPGEVSWYD